MVRSVQPPQQRHFVKHDVLGVNHRIQQRQGYGNGQPARRGEPVQQAPTFSFGQLRRSDRQHRKHQP